MTYKVYWTSHATLTYAEEIEFIFEKWNLKEVEKFILLIDDFIRKISTFPFIGRKFIKRDIYSFVVSKQTTVFYKLRPDEQRIDLLFFHNNKRNPDYLMKVL
jgi:plasmid stabilization system protein ParE